MYFVTNIYTVLPVERRNLIISDIKFEKGTKINNLLGIQAGHILIINILKYYPVCAMEDYAKYIETY